jgi:eukaryotic-like serine/threonine-protein kinase
MSLADQGRTWEEASSPDAVGLARRFEAAWRSDPSSPPDPAVFLPDEPGRRPGALLALLRADLALRREAGEAAQVERYCRHFGDLAEEVLVGLLYEEFCLREEAGEAPDPSEYEARFPAVADQLREVLDIHDLVGSSGSLSLATTDSRAARLPEAGESIGGFHLVEELGRGAFARVFLARERKLGDRPVALKITRAGTREPQTLARLQHTHIVPVHSYRADPVTGLHLLCMPYFGRVTLAAMLADPSGREARTGADLLAVLDRLLPPGEVPSPRAEGRAALSGRSFVRAVAWWGARLAEALDHAHGRGVLHHDIKPSNVLLTADATPMLLDFNLARPGPAGGPDAPPSSLGGTLAYMAPEHLEAVASGSGGGVDGRADVFALGVVLCETLGSRPFSTAIEGRSGPEALRAMIAERHAGPPRLGGAGRPVPSAMEAVIRRCLAPDPDDRYAGAAELAADLQAVADDGPLVYAREPQPARAIRWMSRHRRPIAMALPLALALLAGTAAVFRAREGRLRVEEEVRAALRDGQQRASECAHGIAEANFAQAEALAAGYPSLRALADEAKRGWATAHAANLARATADEFFARAEPLRSRLIEGRGLKEASSALIAAFAPLHVFDPAPWTRRPEVQALDATLREQLVEEVNELLFLWVVASDRPGDPEQARRARAFCNLALSFAEPAGPWLALRAHYEPGPPSPEMPPVPERETSARACFQRAVLAARLDRDHARALDWLERAVQLRSDRFWYQFALAYYYGLFDDVDRALAHYDAALALRRDAPWALFNRAQLYWSRKGAWDRARADLERVLIAPGRPDPSSLRLEFGQVAQRLGDFPRALAEYQEALAIDPEGDPARKALLNRARIVAELGAFDRARADYEALLADDPEDGDARTGRALLALRMGDAEAAEADLSLLLEGPGSPGRRADWLASRALALLVLGRPSEALRDAEEAWRLRPDPRRARLRTRVALAAGLDLAPGAPEPDVVDRLPARGPSLTADLRAAADRLLGPAGRPEVTIALPALLSRALLFAALGRHGEARAEADRAVAIGPASSRALWARALVRRREGDRDGALADVDAGLALDDDPRLRELRARLLLEGGRPREALAEAARALPTGGGPAHAAKARALGLLANVREAIDAWTLALRDDPEDGDAFLGRAGCFLRLGAWDNALAALESAADRAGDDARLLARITASYVACLPARPNRIVRVRLLARRAAVAWLREVSVAGP